MTSHTYLVLSVHNTKWYVICFVATLCFYLSYAGNIYAIDFCSLCTVKTTMWSIDNINNKK